MSPFLFDADLATVSDLAAYRRATTTVLDAQAAYRADLVTDYLRARTWREELRLLRVASQYDQENPDDEIPLVDELSALRTSAAA